ncbi:sigma-70 family RNA polymerase sigma factor [Sulfurisoma sediminicola]|uniref:RNA polymerase sigma-70 factor (ECF subfamily) n=1 Tax=Sulfurisoma sediminicola TaxID=1381557 RepID=A0A497XD73_9PROT|nr:sigma-70 family RNA polymerase sigma factor [Sulfurisoma sediminicola]RLJ64911.1 RNA polymerase sigma-70 factor (ECF subfamily) [Sulfurisoma sediminicola]
MSSRDAIVAEIPRLRRYARALTGNADQADDLVQDTLERALEKWRLWHSARELRPWLFSIMHNLFVDSRRRAGRIDYCDADELDEVPQRSQAGDALELRDLDRALALLPTEQREVLLLVGLEELSYAEAARSLGVPQGTVMSRLSRARSRLQSILNGEAVPQLKVVKT